MPPAPVQKNKYNDFNTILNDNFNLVIVAVVVVLLVASYFLIIQPKFETTLVAIKANIDQQELFYQSQRQKLTDLQAAVVLYRKVGADNIDKINEILPDEYAKERLFGELEDILSQKGLTLDSLQLSKGGEDDKEPLAPSGQGLLSLPNVGTIKAELSLSSVDYVALKNLLPLLEKQLRLIDVEELDFDPAANTVHLIFYTYYFK
ncbi:MAG: hypothetical protein PHE20_00560 [Patescibacteria group bacterium]|nr:hypothetical protein [Patescibacteria group bacterium]